MQIKEICMLTTVYIQYSTLGITLMCDINTLLSVLNTNQFDAKTHINLANTGHFLSKRPSVQVIKPPCAYQWALTDMLSTNVIQKHFLIMLPENVIHRHYISYKTYLLVQRSSIETSFKARVALCDVLYCWFD